jgi:hypothetical protein
MAVTATPVYPQAPAVGSVAVTAANTSSQGGGTIGTDIFLALTAGANGAFIEKIRCVPTATAPTNTTATVGRFFRSTQSSGATTTANTHNIGEVTLPLTAADNATSAAPYIDVPMNITLGAGESLLVTNHAAPAANTQWKFTAFGADL